MRSFQEYVLRRTLPFEILKLHPIAVFLLEFLRKRSPDNVLNTFFAIFQNLVAFLRYGEGLTSVHLVYPLIIKASQN